jgi:alcohol dehydrogenase
MEQKLVVQTDGLSAIQEALLQKGVSTVFVLTGRHVQQPGDRQPFLSFLQPLAIHHYVKNTANVNLHEVEACYHTFLGSGATAIVAIGGGSVMDLAKGVIFYCHENGKAIPYFVAAPTTAGSGSEATCFAVVYRNGKKLSFQHQQLLPALVVLDARLTESLSPQQTAISGIDAVAQAIESYWNIHATEASQQLAQDALNIVRGHLIAAVRVPTLAIRKQVLWGAHLAGKAVNITRTTGPHALSYYLTSRYQVPHGQAVALFLPIFFLYNEGVQEGNCNHPGGPVVVKQVMDQLCRIMGVRHAVDAATYITTLMKDAGLATTFKELGIDTTGLWEPLLNEVNAERVKNNPVAFDRTVLTDLFNRFL